LFVDSPVICSSTAYKWSSFRVLLDRTHSKYLVIHIGQSHLIRNDWFINF
jgi:hypothetical protein